MTYPLHAGAMLSPRPSRRPRVSELLGLGVDVRLLNPTLKQTGGAKPRFYIRPQIERTFPDGTIERKQERVYLKADTRREAMKERSRYLEALNKRQIALTVQVTFGALLDEYLRGHVRRDGALAASTAAKYETHIKNHIRPGFDQVPLGQMTVRSIQDWLDSKVDLSWSTRLDLRNLMCGIFTKAEEWGYWRRDLKSPATFVSAGRKKMVYRREKMTIEQTRNLLAALPEDVSLICSIALFCTLRISEVLGVQEKHIDTTAGRISVEQRYYRGDIGDTKSHSSTRLVPLGHLLDRVKARLTGDPDRFVFFVRTRTSRKGSTRQFEGRISRDDRDINQHFLRPAAKALGVYYKGFGFHAFRAEAVTEMSKGGGRRQVLKLAGHGTETMSQRYTVGDMEEQEQMVRAFQERVMGKPVSGRKQ